MKRLLSIVLIVLMILVLYGCSSKEEKNDLHEVPVGFTEGVEYADINKFSSYASDNGLAGTMVYVEGNYDEVTDMVVNGKNGYHVIFKDNNGDKWLLLLDHEDFSKRKTYEELAYHDLLVIANYHGFSDVYKAPSLYMKTIYDKNTGSMINSGLYSMLSLDEIYISGKAEKTDEETIKQHEPETKEEETITVEPIKEQESVKEPEPVKEEPQADNNTIRPDVKEAIDTFEEFIDEYCRFMKNYSTDSTDFSMMADYASFIGKYAEMSEKMDRLEEDLTDAELTYYTKVMLRCDQKLLEAVQ